ncbi:MAG: DciA family protein [Candidatus Dasytiphilus stammeri]
MRLSNLYSVKKIFEDAKQHNNSILNFLQQRAMILINLDLAVKSVLPSYFNPWYRVANIRHHILILETANAKWMKRLFYKQHSFINILRSKILPSLVSIDFYINPSWKQLINDPKILHEHQIQNIMSYRTISNKSATVLRQLAMKSPDNIKAALEKLADLAKININNEL